MTPKELATVVGLARCRVFGWEDASNDPHRTVVATLVRLFDEPESTVLCDPSLTGRRTRQRPDVVLVHPEAGVHVFEVKGVSLDQIEADPVAGGFTVRYPSGRQRVNPIVQASAAMYAVRDATTDAAGCDQLGVPFQSWVALPLIARAAWTQRWGPGGFDRPELLFADDLAEPALAVRLGAKSRAAGHRGPVQLCPLAELQCVMRAFGDNSVLYTSAEGRPARPPVERGTLGDRIDAAAEAYRALSYDQQRLSAQDWRGGPRLVRGVAGSGKTVVLANNLARRLERMLPPADGNLFAGPGTPLPRPPRLLAVCFNRTLAPFIRRRVEAAYRQRTGQPLPTGAVDVCNFNKLMYDLSRRGLWGYQRVSDEDDGAARAGVYLNALAAIERADPARIDAARYDAIYVDEGQDLADDELRLLVRLCRPGPGGEPDLYIFYDDAQNLYGHRRPTWSTLGINVVGGRSSVMTECFRNTRPVVEAAFNVLYGSYAAANAAKPSRDFADVTYLENQKLIVRDGPAWRVRFARRAGPPPRVAFAADRAAEARLLVDRLRWLLGEQRVRPEDVLVLTPRTDRVTELARAIAAAALPGVDRVRTPLAQEDRDRLLVDRGELAVSTVKSAKGYDAPCVLLVSANELTGKVGDRAEFYVACTRAAEHLEVLAYRRDGLAAEFERAAAALPTPR